MSDFQAWQVYSGAARTILLTSITGGIVTLALLALKPLIKNRLPKSIQYYLWLLVLIAFLVPFSAFVSIPASTPLAPVQALLREHVKSTPEWREELAQTEFDMSYEELEVHQQVEVLADFGFVKGDFNNHLLSLLMIPGMIYFVGDIVGYLIFARRLRRRRIPPRESEHALLPPGSPRLFRSPLAPTPMLVGLFFPVIYLPDEEYTRAQLESILLHELTHLRRKDIAVKWVTALAVRIHWFNPLAWMARREIDRSCELACDEAVIKNMDKDGRQSYGDTLIAMAADTKKPKMIVSTTMCEEKKTLRERLGAIMKHRRFSAWAAAVSCALAAVLLCGTVVLGASSKSETAAELQLPDEDSFVFYDGDGNIYWDMPAFSPPRNDRDKLLTDMRENVPPEGLTLEITAAGDDAEFLLTNKTESIVEYGYANRVERYVDGAWEIAIAETKEIFPENPLPLQPGHRMYGMTAWIRDGTTLAPGTYRYLMLVVVKSGDMPDIPVVLEAPFEIAE